jgi:hypothetical protein
MMGHASMRGYSLMMGNVWIEDFADEGQWAVGEYSLMMDKWWVKEGFAHDGRYWSTMDRRDDFAVDVRVVDERMGEEMVPQYVADNRLDRCQKILLLMDEEVGCWVMDRRESLALGCGRDWWESGCTPMMRGIGESVVGCWYGRR